MNTKQNEHKRKPVALHRLVRQVRICGHDVKIVESNPDGWNNNAMGRSCCIKGRILLHEGLPPTQKAGVLLHEIFHSIADLNGLKSICDDETTISVLANSVLALMRDNRGMIEDILNLSNNQRSNPLRETKTEGESHE